ncbi:hypothetical protein HPP92_015577 [Vanilla planifolia]|uniref:Uncharacterized protein n=1 Tax=Vanilla planifolia TaxID=51239 RepID=A0A835QI60_VANPL|nr:hypothetical protein HPP92_015577 [Vanilla planifolia]
MDSYALHMAMAALAGASLAAVSSYFLHRKALAELLEFALSVERGRGTGEADISVSSEKDGGCVSSPSKRMKKRLRRGMKRHGRRWRSKRCGSVEVVDEVFDEIARDAATGGRFFSQIECLPGGTLESDHGLSDFFTD